MGSMLLSILIAVLGAAAIASAQSATPSAANAPEVTGNPIGASYLAVLPEKAGSTVRGSISASSSPDGKGVLFQVALSGLPTEGGPFMYHIHEKPVPADGNCTGTGAHLDPYKRGETPPCDPALKQQCQTGDLSGKYGKFNGTAYSNAYTDLYSSTIPTNPAFFGNLSVVVHLANKTRISCANFTTIAIGSENPIPPVSPSSGYALPTTVVQNATLGVSATATGTGGPNSGADESGHASATATPPSPSAPAQSNSGAKLLAGASALVGGTVVMLLV
ncbi:Cu,Zn superoxide dismutase-like protein [Lindgomyces ingoldianus]|uniref:Cu,Zn superoxide dismutase-like protein n=1 Tax=Lindgomyces ingoldianus TaxID=673940 RepID=A0ACB6Q9Y6_9PLEO|nr:Cu,Zn superoxide dismutase-like protein [Lindgomyces ingoldianus]KAF2463182.1 Cu,Zn superoxide dismutase-like protein [Lindgomyces ingoldianus]